MAATTHPMARMGTPHPQPVVRSASTDRKTVLPTIPEAADVADDRCHIDLDQTAIGNEMEIKDYVGLWGAALSTLLGVVKLVEVWRSRIKLEVAYNFTASPDVGNEITIRNPGATPVLITQWRLIWRHRNLLKWQQSRTVDPDDLIQDISLAAHSSKTLVFRGQDHFDTSSSSLGMDAIYVSIWYAGRTTPIVLKLYDGK